MGEQGGGTSRPEPSLPKVTPCTSTFPLQVLSLNQIPGTLSALVSSQLSWKREVGGCTFCQGCSDCAESGSLKNPRQTKLPPDLESTLCQTCWSKVDIQPLRYIPGRQTRIPEYLQTETAPSSFNNRKKYSDVDKSTHPVKFFSFPLGSFFPPRCCCFLN